MFLRLTQTKSGEINLMVGHIVGFGPTAEGSDGACNVMLTGNQTVVIDETPRTLRARIKKALSTNGATESTGDDEAEEEAPVAQTAEVQTETAPEAVAA